MLWVLILLHGLQLSLLLLMVSQSYFLENLFFCTSIQQLCQLALQDELHSKGVATVCAEEVDTVDEEAEDEVASHCKDSGSVPAPVSILSGMSAVVHTLMLVCKK
jgi:hypothetical protein